MEEPKTVAEMRARYRAAHARLFPSRPPKPKPAPPAPPPPAIKLMPARPLQPSRPRRDWRGPIMTIAGLVAQRMDVSIEAMRSNSRLGNLVLARHLTFYITKVLVKATLPALGRVLQRDHASVLHGLRRIENDMAADPHFRDEVMLLVGEADRVLQAKKGLTNGTN